MSKVQKAQVLGFESREEFSALGSTGLQNTCLLNEQAILIQYD